MGLLTYLPSLTALMGLLAVTVPAIMFYSNHDNATYYRNAPAGGRYDIRTISDVGSRYDEYFASAVLLSITSFVHLLTTCIQYVFISRSCMQWLGRCGCVWTRLFLVFGVLTSVGICGTGFVSSKAASPWHHNFAFSFIGGGLIQSLIHLCIMHRAATTEKYNGSSYLLDNNQPESKYLNRPRWSRVVKWTTTGCMLLAFGSLVGFMTAEDKSSAKSVCEYGIVLCLLLMNLGFQVPLARTGVHIQFGFEGSGTTCSDPNPSPTNDGSLPMQEVLIDDAARESIHAL